MALGENQQIPLHPLTTRPHAYLLNMTPGRSLVDDRVAGEPNAIGGIGRFLHHAHVGCTTGKNVAAVRQFFAVRSPHGKEVFAIQRH